MGTEVTKENQALLDVKELLRRYGGADFKALRAILCPLLVPINTLDKKIFKAPSQKYWRASFSVKIDQENEGVMVIGRTGKFLPETFKTGGTWREIGKGRIIEIDNEQALARGEVYTGMGTSKTDLEAALHELSENALWEVDQFGASAKVLSALVEHAFCTRAQEEGFKVKRMPEDMAQHLGIYANYDFQLEKEGIIKRLEVKSLWGTDTRYARLIHSKSNKAPTGPKEEWTADQIANYYPTSSCRFSTQDIFAVSLFLRTGHLKDFAFARSVPANDKISYGLPHAPAFPDHVNQNPLCEIGNGAWFSKISDVWELP